MRVNLTISAASLLGIDDEPARIPGVGTIDAVTARALAHEGIWRRIVTDPLTGAVLDVGRTRYRPPAALAAHVAATNPHCVCAACSQPAERCDLDHVTEWHEDGTTAATNLAPLCRASHTLKTDGHMHLAVTAPGRYRWTTPLGKTYDITTTSGTPRRRPAPFPETPPF
ncbi:MAG: HNH endonuclease [Micrococcales bacterium]|nr:HNH endonuclease [Micrococcales bacterium]